MCLINKKMTNIRKTNSVEKLKNALIELLLEKDYSEISVSDITKKAGVSRGTFYQHFLDKDDLATTIGEKTSQKFRNILSKGNLDKQDKILESLDYIKWMPSTSSNLSRTSCAVL